MVIGASGMSYTQTHMEGALVGPTGPSVGSGLSVGFTMGVTLAPLIVAFPLLTLMAKLIFPAFLSLNTFLSGFLMLHPLPHVPLEEITFLPSTTNVRVQIHLEFSFSFLKTAVTLALSSI